MHLGPEEALVEAELARRYALDRSWTFHVDIAQIDADGAIHFTAEVVREHEAGGRWCWFRGTRGADGTWSVEAAEPHSFGPEGADENVVRARRRAVGRPVLGEARVDIVETELRRRIPQLSRWPTTRVSRERIDGNETVFDFATLGWEGVEPRRAVWYVGTARVDLDTYRVTIDAREHPRSRLLERSKQTPRAALDAAVEEAWLELGFPATVTFLGAREKRELLIAELRRVRPLDGTRSRLGHVNLRGEPDRSGAFHFSAEVWEADGAGGAVHAYRGVVSPRGTSKIEALEPLVFGASGIDGVALRRRRIALILPLFDPSERRAMAAALLRAAGHPSDVEIRTTEEMPSPGSTELAFAAMSSDGSGYTGKVAYDLESNTFDGAVTKVDGEPSWSSLGFLRADAAGDLPNVRDASPPRMAPAEAVLLAAIHATPEDDAPRLALAARLARLGDPRGELIRLQCKQARTGNTQELQDRVAELLRAHEKTWVSAAGIQGARTVFSRGWPAVLLGSCAQIVASRDALRTQPIVELSVTSGLERWSELMALPEIAGIRKLALHPVRDHRRESPLPPRVIEELAQNESLRGLRELSFAPPALDDAGAQLLAKARWLPQLEGLMLSGNPLGPTAVAALVAPLLAVRRLGLAGCRCGAVGAAAIATSMMRQLESLRLEDASIQADAMVALAGSPVLATVTLLDLGRNLVRDDGVIAIARSPYVGRLRELRLRENGIGPEGAEALAASTALSSLEMLELRNNRLGHAGVDALASGTGLPALRRLEISRNEVYTGQLISREGGSEAAGDYMTWMEQVEETREQLAARFAKKPGLVVT